MVLFDLTFLPFYFDLTFTVFFHSSVLMHPEPHSDLDNLNTVQHNLRNFAKGSNDAYNVTVSLTQSAPWWRALADQLEVLFVDDDEGAFIIPALDTRSQVLSIRDRRNGIGKPVYKLAPFGSGQLFALVAPDLCVPGVPGEVLQRILSQASTATV